MLTDKFFTIAEVGHEATLILLLVLSVLSIAFIIERWIALKQLKKDAKHASEQVREILQSNDFSKLKKLGSNVNSLEGQALSYGLRHFEQNGDRGLEEVFTTFAITEKPKLEKSLNFLATVGSNAPFIGLLGTVFGIMDAFRGLATSQGDASAVMIGISKALVATAIGLLVAIPAVIAYNTYSKQVKTIMQSIEGVKELCLAYAKSFKG